VVGWREALEVTALAGGEARGGGGRGTGGIGNRRRRQGRSPVAKQHEAYQEVALVGGGGAGQRRQGREVGRCGVEQAARGQSVGRARWGRVWERGSVEVHVGVDHSVY
jgi:hypothetical protein